MVCWKRTFWLAVRYMISDYNYWKVMSYKTSHITNKTWKVNMIKKMARIRSCDCWADQSCRFGWHKLRLLEKCDNSEPSSIIYSSVIIFILSFVLIIFSLFHLVSFIFMSGIFISFIISFFKGWCEKSSIC